MPQIRRYLQVSQRAWFHQVRDAKMTDISTTQMNFTYSGKPATIHFDPPMKSLREARDRLVQMDKDSLQSLGRSDIPLTTFLPPYQHPGHLFNFTTCIATYAAFASRANFTSGSLLYDSLLFRAPGFASFCWSIQPYLFWIMVGIHAFEGLLMMRKLARHGVDPLQGIWWMWVGSCFVEGAPSFWRLGAWVADRRAEKEAKKH